MEPKPKLHETLWGPVDEDGKRFDANLYELKKALAFAERYGARSKTTIPALGAFYEKWRKVVGR